MDACVLPAVVCRDGKGVGTVPVLQRRQSAAGAVKLQIDRDRLTRWIDELALISEAPPPAVTRVLFSVADQKAREWVRARCAELQFRVRQDAVGNLFATWEGRD